MAVAYQYKVEGINCINCANGIKSHLSKKLSKSKYQYFKGIVTIYNDQYNAMKLIIIDDLGYKTTFLERSKTNYKRNAISFFALLSLPFRSYVCWEDHFSQPWLQICLSTPFYLSAINTLLQVL